MKNRLFLICLCCAVFAAGGMAGQWRQATASEAEKLPAKELQELTEIYIRIKQDYVEDIAGDDLIKRAARGMVASLDPHSAYLDNTEYGDFVEGLTNEEYGGVGIYIGVREGWISIIAPIYGSPAARAGLEAGDLILKIEGETTQGMPTAQAVEKMRGVVDTVLKLEIQPAAGGEIKKVELVRETIIAPSVLSSLVGEGYGYLRITRFQNKTLEDLVNGINGMYRENGAPLKGIILDMRNNPGGYLLSGVGAAAVFLPPGSGVVLEKGRDKTKVKKFVAHDEHYAGLESPDLLQSVPLVALVNNGSASAAEIVAGALQDHRRAVILGTRTYGKASVQSLQPLHSSKGKSALRLTTARYYTPLDRNIQARGIEPDVVINPAAVRQEEDEDDRFIIREDDVTGHLENDSSEDAANEETAPERPPFIGENDYQYDQALQILKALAVTAAR